MRRRVGLTIAAAVFLGACTPSARSSGNDRFDRNRLTREQLNATNVDNLFQAIEKLRPEWLTSRGPTSITDATVTVPSVYLNGQMLGKLDFLKDMRPMEVETVRFWPAGQASARFGMGHPRGVIEISRQ
jgi:GDP-D-mannose dehydratase